MFPGEVEKQWKQWVKRVHVIGFNNGKYYKNMINKYFLKEYNGDVFAAKKKNDYMFLHSNFKTTLNLG